MCFGNILLQISFVMKYLFFYLFCLSIFFSSCVSERKMTDLFDVEECLVPQSVALEHDSIQNPILMRVVDNRLFLSNVFCSPILTIFDCENGKCIGHFGNKGVGKDEFIDFNSISSLNHSLVLYDNNKSECIIIENVDSLDDYDRIKIQKGEDFQPFNIVGLDKDLLLGTGIIKNGRFALLGKDGTFLSVFGQYPLENKTEKQNYISDAFAYQSHVAYLATTNILAVGNYFGEGISFYDMTDISSPKLVGDIQLRCPSYKDTSNDGSLSVTFTKDNIIGFIDLVSFGNTFIGLYCGEKKEKGKMWKGGNILLFFDSSGNPIKEVKLSEKYLQLSVFKSELYLLGIAPETDDYVIKKIDLKKVIE